MKPDELQQLKDFAIKDGYKKLVEHVERLEKMSYRTPPTLTELLKENERLAKRVIELSEKLNKLIK